MQRGAAAGGRRCGRGSDGLAVLGARLADEGVHVDEARRHDVATAVDDVGVGRNTGRGHGGAGGADGALLDEHAAASLGAGDGIDEAGVDECEGARLSHRRDL